VPARALTGNNVEAPHSTLFRMFTVDKADGDAAAAVPQ